MGKGGGGYDAGPMLEYGDKALALQRQIYDDSVARTQPYYDTGTSALDMLSDVLGLKGGSVMSRDQIYNELMPQYTTTQNMGGVGEYLSPEGSVVRIPSAKDFIDNKYKYFQGEIQNESALLLSGQGRYDEALESLGYSPYSTSSGS